MFSPPANPSRLSFMIGRTRDGLGLLLGQGTGTSGPGGRAATFSATKSRQRVRSRSLYHGTLPSGRTLGFRRLLWTGQWCDQNAVVRGRDRCPLYRRLRTCRPAGHSVRVLTLNGRRRPNWYARPEISPPRFQNPFFLLTASPRSFSQIGKIWRRHHAHRMVEKDPLVMSRVVWVESQSGPE